MAKRRPDLTKKLRLREWLLYLGRKQGEVAAGAGIDKGYMSELVNGLKDNPAASQVYAISVELGITVNDLYDLPPQSAYAQRRRRVTPADIEAFRSLMDKLEPSDTDN